MRRFFKLSRIVSGAGNGIIRPHSLFVDSLTRTRAVGALDIKRRYLATAPGKTIYKCSNCEKETLKWAGQCPQCKSWNTLEETTVSAPPASAQIAKVERERQKWIGEDETQMTNAAEQAKQAESHRVQFNDPELKRVFGGGLVLGSVVLLAGTPGVGKSTLAMQLADMVSQQLPNQRRVLYVSGEESVEQVGMRAKRLRTNPISFTRVDIVNQPNLNKVLSSLSPTGKHAALIVDSIQTVFLDDVDGDTGGVVQIRACALACVHMAKSSKIPVILVGHVTKSGDVAGPKMLEHLVDVVLYFDGESANSEIRWLHCHKNRFGPNEVGVFHLMDNGLVAMSESSLSFVSNHGKTDKVPQGVAWCITSQGAQGTRFVVAEVQALTNPIFYDSSGSSSSPRPRKTRSSGVSLERIDWLTAVIAKHVPGGKVLNQSDMFINVVGGLHSNDRGNDLAFAIAMASSALGAELVWPRNGRDRLGIAFVGEIGLTGDVRPVHAMWSRVSAASKAGLARLVVPKRWWDDNQGKGEGERKRVDDSDMEIVPVEYLSEAVSKCLMRQETIGDASPSKQRSGLRKTKESNRLSSS